MYLTLSIVLRATIMIIVKLHVVDPLLALAVPNSAMTIKMLCNRKGITLHSQNLALDGYLKKKFILSQNASYTEDRKHVDPEPLLLELSKSLRHINTQTPIFLSTGTFVKLPSSTDAEKNAMICTIIAAH